MSGLSSSRTMWRICPVASAFSNAWMACNKVTLERPWFKVALLSMVPAQMSLWSTRPRPAQTCSTASLEGPPYDTSSHGFWPILPAMHSRARRSLAAVLKELNEPMQIGAPCCTTVAWRAILSRLQKEVLKLLNFWVKGLRDTSDGHIRLLSVLRRAL